MSIGIKNKIDDNTTWIDWLIVGVVLGIAITNLFK